VHDTRYERFIFLLFLGKDCSRDWIPSTAVDVFVVDPAEDGDESDIDEIHKIGAAPGGNSSV
jgi:hypothetical protein